MFSIEFYTARVVFQNVNGIPPSNWRVLARRTAYKFLINKYIKDKGFVVAVNLIADHPPYRFDSTDLLYTLSFTLLCLKLVAGEIWKARVTVVGKDLICSKVGHFLCFIKVDSLPYGMEYCQDATGSYFKSILDNTTFSVGDWVLVQVQSTIQGKLRMAAIVKLVNN